MRWSISTSILIILLQLAATDTACSAQSSQTWPRDAVLATADNVADVTRESAASAGEAKSDHESTGAAASISDPALIEGPCLEERARLLSKIHAAEAQGVGIQPYKTELDKIAALLLDNPDRKDEAMDRLHSLEDSLNQQLASKKTAGVQYGNLTVYTGPPTLSVREYDPSNPPAQIVSDGGFEGWTQWNIVPTVRVHWNSSAQIVSQATVILSCSIVEWIPARCSQKLKSHEQGHVKICTTIYDRGPIITREIAQKYLMNRPWAGGAASTQFEAAYRQEITDVISWLSKTYDLITKHGVNSIDSDTAVAAAFQQCYRSYRPYLAPEKK